MNKSASALQVLQNVFGYPAFRPLQSEIVAAVLGGRDTLALLPTGGGKSLCYQVPGLVLGGTTLVISPLIALMEDQVQALVKKGVTAAYLTSQQDPAEQLIILTAAGKGEYQFLYLAPERLSSPQFLALAKNLRFSLVAIDEAHCISSWGHDFRPAYRQIAVFLRRLSSRPTVMALTATATTHVQKDICQNLGLRQPAIFTQPFRRPNLQFWARVCNHGHHKKLLFFQLLKNLRGAGVIYALTRDGTVQLATELRKLGFTAEVYHGGLAAAERSRVLQAFLNNQVQVVVATNAFGMGVDKSNVRWVVHWQIPANLENYYQEAGRAGRDGQPAQCFLLYCAEDLEIHHQIWQSSRLPKTAASAELQQIRQQKLDQIIKYAQTKTCRENFILDYFDQAKTPQGCQHCDSCRKWQIPVSTEQRKKIAIAATLARQIRLPRGIYFSQNLQQAWVILGKQPFTKPIGLPP